MAFKEPASDGPPQEGETIREMRSLSATLPNASAHGLRQRRYASLSGKESLFRTRSQINAGLLRLEFHMPPEAKKPAAEQAAVGTTACTLYCNVSDRTKIRHKLNAEKTPSNLSGKQKKKTHHS